MSTKLYNLGSLSAVEKLLEERPEPDQMACMRRLFFQSRTMALTNARQRVEASSDPAMALGANQPMKPKKI